MPTNRQQRRDYLKSFKGKGGPARTARKNLFGSYGRNLINYFASLGKGIQ